MEQFLEKSYFGNTVLAYMTAVGIFILGVLVVYVFKKIILSRLEKWAENTETKLDDLLVKGVEKSIIPLLYFGAFYTAAQTLTLVPKFAKTLQVASVILLTFYFLKSLTAVLNHAFISYIRRKKHGAEREKQMRGITTVANILIWVLGLLFLLDNLGFKISSVVAGLGIGGIAIALAAQAVLGDLFSYFVIFFDRPFEIGDFLVIGDKVGSVEYIGIKTTRIRALGGEQLIFHNTDLTNSRIHNYKKMERRRVVFKIGVIYQTKADQLEEIPNMVKKIIEDQEDAVFDRGHFATFGDFSLNFEFVYYVIGADYVHYMDIQQAINLNIYREFEENGIEFAYPTQTLFMNKENQ
ncbi:MAG: mechanosensitive ion channel domain-containing protein [Ignavibacteriaceae bacterium]